ncbi:MAG TPA: SDR family NAD(P)-dependent oxidoreductase, partial [Lichenihabitans sp.]|nr:SDR family NAD(P)-dependent oxidoreductase [Lichenihabitans sp.]
MAIVTGAGQGIGRAIATRLSREGAAVAILDKNPETGEEAAAKLRQLGGRAKFATCDVTDRESVRHAVTIVEAEYGPISALVNNAGIGVRGRFLELSQD